MKITLAVRRLLAAVLLLALFATACGAAEDGELTASDVSDTSEPLAAEGASEAASDVASSDADAPSASFDEPVAAADAEESGVMESDRFAGDEEAMDDDGAMDDATVMDDAVDRLSMADTSRSIDDELSEAAGDDVAAPAATSVPRDPEEEDVVSEPVEPTPRPRAGLLTAGDLDDNLNYEFFGDWISQVQQRQAANVPSANLNDRIRLEVRNGDIVGLGNVPITISDGDNAVTLHTSTGGVAWLYPHHVGLSTEAPLRVEVRNHDGSLLAEATIDDEVRTGDRSLVISVDAANKLPEALDIALVLDVTGSMTDELAYLTEELQAIIASVQADYSNVDVAVGLIVYRDVGDEFVTRVFDFADVETIRGQLEEQQANGGGDFPEAMHTALEASLEELSWRSGNVARMLVLNADAPPHAEFLDTTVQIGRELTAAGVRIYPLAASGVDETAEFTMRVLAATSGGRHMFLTDDSGIGNGHSEPKAECYQVTALNDLLRRVIASELAGERIEANQSAVVRTVGQVADGRCI